MEVYIKSSQKLEFSGSMRSTTLVADANLSKMWFSQASSKYFKRYMSLLKIALIPKFETKRPRFSELLNWRVQLELDTGDQLNTVTALITSANEIGKTCLIHQLNAALGDVANFKVGFLLGSENRTKTPNGIKAEPVTIETWEVDGKNVYGFNTTHDHKALCEALTAHERVGSMDLTVKIVINDDGLEHLRIKNLTNPLSINHKLLTQTETMDTVIITGTGTTVKCHKVFLSAHSVVFQAMFQSSMAEGSTGTLKLVDMTEAGVHALLKYLYTWELTEALNDPSISVELIISAEKYDIKKLENEARDLILSKDKNWFTVSSALQLLHFAKTKLATATSENNAGYTILEEKAVEVLKLMPTQELNACKEYKELFDDPVTGMEFCSYMMSKTQNMIKSDYLEI